MTIPDEIEQRAREIMRSVLTEAETNLRFARKQIDGHERYVDLCLQLARGALQWEAEHGAASAEEIAGLLALKEGLPEGPWTVDHDVRDGMDWNNHITDVYDDRICFMAHSGTSDNRKLEAAARAIAAIPSMLAALQAQAREIERLNVILGNHGVIQLEKTEIMVAQKERIAELEAERD